MPEEGVQEGRSSDLRLCARLCELERLAAPLVPGLVRVVLAEVPVGGSGAHSVPKSPWFPGESRGIVVGAECR